jgi:hypothetical protein
LLLLLLQALQAAIAAAAAFTACRRVPCMHMPYGSGCYT